MKARTKRLVDGGTPYTVCCFSVTPSAPTTGELMDQSRVRNTKYRERADRSAPPDWEKKKKRLRSVQRWTEASSKRDEKAASPGFPVTLDKASWPPPTLRDQETHSGVELLPRATQPPSQGFPPPVT